jgi:hypothetical protein
MYACRVGGRSGRCRSLAVQMISCMSSVSRQLSESLTIGTIRSWNHRFSVRCSKRSSLSSRYCLSSRYMVSEMEA